MLLKIYSQNVKIQKLNIANVELGSCTEVLDTKKKKTRMLFIATVYM